MPQVYSVREENMVRSRMLRLCTTNKDLPEILQTCPCASKPATFVLVSEQLVLPAGHSSGAERKNKTSHFKQSFSSISAVTDILKLYEKLKLLKNYSSSTVNDSSCHLPFSKTHREFCRLHRNQASCFSCTTKTSPTFCP